MCGQHSSFSIGFKCQSQRNQVTVAKQADAQFCSVGGGPTWVTSWPLLSWGLALPNTYLSFRPHSYSGNSVKKVVYQEKGRQSGRESCVSGTSRAQEVPGLYVSSSPSRAGTEAPSPAEHGHRRWYSPCPSASQPRDVRVCGTGAGVQGVLKSTASQVMLTCSRDETHGSAVCSSQTRQRKPREVKSLA